MPVPGAMGAIAAANRRKRAGTSMTYKPSSSVALKGSIPHATPSTESCKSESSQSMMSRLKQQAQETSVYLKKQQSAFSSQVQKGIKMASGLTSSQKKDDLGQQSQVPSAPLGHVIEQNDALLSMVGRGHIGKDQIAEWISALEQMGFQKVHILEAVTMLGDKLETLDDLLQVVVTMASDQSTGSDTATSSTMPACSRMVKQDLSESKALASADAPSEDKEESVEPKPPLPAPLSPPPLPRMSACGSAEFEKAEGSPPPLPSMSACGSAAFEKAEDKKKFLYSAPPKLNPRIYEALHQMGFESEAIHAAFRLLGEQASVDDFFDLLLRMPDVAQRSMQVPMDSAASSSCEEVFDVSGDDSEEGHENLSAELPLEEPSTKDMAAAIVAAVVAKAATLIPQEQGACAATKQFADRASPVRGGA